MKKLFAFTLAETLIVIGIIGIVATLTVPNLNNSTGHKESITKVKKIYAELTEAHNRAVSKYGSVPTWFVNDTCSNETLPCKKRYLNRITEFLSVQKTCIDSDNGCFSFSKHPMDDSTNLSGSGYPSAVLRNGSSIYISSKWFDVKCNRDFYNTGTGVHNCGHIIVDIDGPNKGKNQYGFDLFSFAITKDGISFVYGDKYASSYFGKYCLILGHSCINWIMSKDNMDYVYSYKDPYHLKCKDGTDLTWARGSCK